MGSDQLQALLDKKSMEMVKKISVPDTTCSAPTEDGHPFIHEF